MDKKSLFLATLLIGGLFTPQEIKPVAIFLGCATAAYIYALLNYEGYIKHNHLKKYGIKEQSDIKKYKAHIKLSKEEKSFFEITHTEINPEKLFAQIAESIDPNKEEKNKTLTLTCSIISGLNDKEYVIKTIKTSRFSKITKNAKTDKFLLKKLQKIFLIKKERPRNTINQIIKGTLLAITGAYLITMDMFILIFMFPVSCR